MKELISENLIKTEKIVIKNEQGESVRTEEIESPAQNISTYSLTNSSDNQTQEEIQLASGETAVYVEQYSNIQDLRKAIEQNYPEKDDEEVAKDILLAINQEDLAENMTTGELINALEFKDTCGMGVIPLSNNNTVSLASVNNEYGSLDENNEDLNSYIFAAYYGKNGAGNAEFYAYSTIRWKKEEISPLRDIMVIAHNKGTACYRIENSRLAHGIKGYLQNTIRCKNIKVAGLWPTEDELANPYSTKTNTYIYETERVDNQIFSNNNQQITVEKLGNIVMCTAPMNLGYGLCNEKVELPNFIEHFPTLTENKLFVSSYFTVGSEVGSSFFGGAYYHTKKELSVSTTVGLGISFNGSFSFSGSIGESFVEKYFKKEYYTPQIMVQFNDKREFYGFSQ